MKGGGEGGRRIGEGKKGRKEDGEGKTDRQTEILVFVQSLLKDYWGFPV